MNFLRGSRSGPPVARFAVALVALALAGCGAGSHAVAPTVPHGAVATIDGAPITVAAYRRAERYEQLVASQYFSGNKTFAGATPELISFRAPYSDCISAAQQGFPLPWIRSQPASELRTYCAAITPQLRQRAVNSLLSARVYAAEAKQQQIAVTPAQRRAARKEIEQQVLGTTGPAWRSRAAAVGVPVSVVRAQAQSLAVQTALLNRVAANSIKHITDADLEPLYRQSRTEFVTAPQTREVQIVVASSEAKAQAAARALAAGTSFATVLARDGADTAAARKASGTRKGVSERQLGTALGTAVFKAQPGATVGPIKASSGYDAARIVSVTAARYLSFAQARPTLVKAYEQERPQEAEAQWQSRLTAIWRKRIKCAAGYNKVPLCGYNPPPVKLPPPPPGFKEQGNSGIALPTTSTSGSASR